MNSVLHQGAETVAPFGWLLGLMTAAFLITFAAWTLWAWLPRNQKRFEEASRIPLEES